MATIKAGTYRFNDNVDITNAFSMSINFRTPVINTSIFGETYIDVTSLSIEYSSSDGSNLLFYTGNLYSNGELYTSMTRRVYSNEYKWNDLAEASKSYGFPEGYGQIIIIDTEQDIDDDTSAAWFIDSTNYNEVNPTPAVEISYKGEKIELSAGDVATLHIKDHKLTEDLVIKANAVSGSGGGSCSGNHIIEVETLPTENIDENALYKMGESYYKVGGKALKDVLALNGGTVSSLVEEYTKAYNAKFELYYADNVEDIPEADRKAPDESTLVFPLYYDAYTSDVKIWAGIWVSLSESLLEGMTSGGAITDSGEVTAEGVYYALIGDAWKKYGVLDGKIVIEVNELPTDSIDVSAIYCVKATECIDAMIPAGSWGYLQWKAYCESLGLLHNIFNVKALPTENIGETIDGVSSYPYYVTSENKVYAYRGGAWVSYPIELVMGTTESYYTYGSIGFELLKSQAVKDAEITAQIKRENSWGNGTRYFKYILSDDGTHYELDVGQKSTLKNWVVASEINGIPVTKIKGCAGYGVPDNPFSLTTLVIPDTITEIESNSFYTVESVDVLIIGKGVTNIRDPFLTEDFPVRLVVYAGTEEEWAAVYKPQRLYKSIVYGS